MQIADEIIQFWFVEHTFEDWFGSKPEFDEKLKTRYFDLFQQVSAGEKSHWRKKPEGRLAEILVLDQFSRQFFRGRARAFATDAMALTLAQELVASGQDKSLGHAQRNFAYLPFMHSESLKIHDESVRIYTELGDENNLKYELAHRDVIVKFSRFPKRNAALGRDSTPEEIEYMRGREGEHF